MADINSPHDNIDVRINSKIQIYGHVLLIGSIFSGSIGIFFLALFTITHFSQAVVLSSVYIYGISFLLGLSLLGMVLGLWVKLVIVPGSRAYAAAVEARGQAKRNKLIHIQDNAAVIENEQGHLEVVPLLTMQQRDIFHHKPEPPLIEAPVTDPLPSLVRYEDVSHKIPVGHTLLGCLTRDRPETRPFEVLDTMWVCGGSGTGKSNGIVIKVKEGHDIGRRLVVIDPHKTKSDSLYHAIRGFEHDFLLPVAHTREQIKQAIIVFKEEAIRRIAGGAYREGWTLIIDEVGALTGAPGLRDDEQTEMYRLIAPIAKMCGEQLRGYDMSGWFISQSPIGLSWLANSAMTVFVHKMIKENQQRLATNNNAQIMEDMANWPKGRVFCYGLDIQGEYLLQQPVITAHVVDSYAIEPLADLAQNPFTGFTPCVKSFTPPENTPQADARTTVNFTSTTIDNAQKSVDTSSVVKEKRDIITRLLASGMGKSQVAEMVGMTGRHYRTFLAVCDEEKERASLNF